MHNFAVPLVTPLKPIKARHLQKKERNSLKIPYKKLIQIKKNFLLNKQTE